MPILQFKGKTFVQNHHLAVPYHQLVPKPDKSITEKVSLNDNLIIHGDNLLALKALLPTYAGKVKCIYIDPPYNKGNENWIYNDNVNSPLIKEWIGKVVGKEGEDLVRHDKWLCMMMPRLKILKDLLSKDGVIFVSIGDHEIHRLRVLMDEVFDDARFAGLVTWKARVKPVNVGDSVYRPQREVEYVLVYEKNAGTGDFQPLYSGSERSYPHEIDGRRYRLATILKSNRGASNRPTMVFDLGDYSPPEGQRWQASEDEILRLNESGYIEFRDGTPFRRYFEDEESASHDPFYCFLKNEWSSTSENGKHELNEILGMNHGFDTVKPTRLVKTLIQTITKKDEEAIVLDSFAGSGTTAQAVLELNKEDGGNRKFILTECEDYADQITAERVRRVIKGSPKSKKKIVQKGLGGSFSFFELGDAIEMESLLSGEGLPGYEELARYLYYTATGDEFVPNKLDEASHFIGSNDDYDVFVYYKPDIEYLKTTALTLDEARTLRERSGSKPLLVFAPTKYVEQQTLDELKITFCQLPFEIYRMKK